MKPANKEKVDCLRSVLGTLVFIIMSLCFPNVFLFNAWMLFDVAIDSHLPTRSRLGLKSNMSEKPVFESGDNKEQHGKDHVISRHERSSNR